MEKETNKTLIWSWALYDWANSAFATTIIAGFFPLFFKQYWSHGFSVQESTYLLGIVNSVTSFILALISPALGAIADQGGWRKKFLFSFTLLGILGTTGLGISGQGEWLKASIYFSLGMAGFTGALTFYDALLIHITNPKNFDRVSGLGYALGYLGGGILFAVNVAMFLRPSFFGLADGAQAIRVSFFTVAVWWGIFSIPIFAKVSEPVRTKADTAPGKLITLGFKTVALHLQTIRKQKALLFFLIGFLFYNDAVNTIIKMAVDYGLSLGLKPEDLIKALLMVQFIGFPAAIGFGYLGERLGAKLGITFCLVVYLLVTIYAYFIDSATDFFILAAAIGLVQGGIQALSRSYYARLIPAHESAEYFGFFNMIGKFSSIIGPFLVGAVGLWLHNSRVGILVLTLFFVVGGSFLFLSERVQSKA